MLLDILFTPGAGSHYSFTGHPDILMELVNKVLYQNFERFTLGITSAEETAKKIEEEINNLVK